MGSEILKNDLLNSKGKIITIFLESGFRHECEVIDCDDEVVKIRDVVKNKIKILKLNQIVDVDI